MAKRGDARTDLVPRLGQRLALLLRQKAGEVVEPCLDRICKVSQMVASIGIASG